MKFKSLLETRKLTLVVTLPQTMECVQAVLKGGAEALKMRCNYSSMNALSTGFPNGPFREMKEFFKNVIEMAGEVPVGLVPGDKGSFITEAERVEVEEMGFDYFNIHYRYVPSFMFESKVLTSVVAITHDAYDSIILDGINHSPKVDIVEANFVPREEMGTKLVYGDILRYTSITKRLQKPIIATAQRYIRPGEVKHFYEAGCKALMIGLVNFIAESPNHVPTPEVCLRTIAEFREAIDKL